jgi:hypothetical protein
MRRTVVVTFLGALSACTGKAKEEPETTMNPPPAPAPAPAPPTEPAPPPPEAALDRGRFTKVLNAQHEQHGRVFRKQEAVCYVNLPFPPQEGPPVSFRPPPQQEVACPPSMTDPAWAECAHGTVTSTDDGAECLCAVMGNPPPPPRVVSCPKT